MRSSKSRSRSKSNRNRPQGGNVLNRVFDSSGPEGKVRGTPQQIIDKYSQLARDAQLGNDRVAAENFQQHAEHYLRLAATAQREQAERQAQQQQQQQNRAQQNQGGEQGNGAQSRGDQNRAQQPRVERPAAGDQPQPTDGRQDASAATEVQPETTNDTTASTGDVIDLGKPEESSGLVETPESKPRTRRPRRKAEPKPAPAAETPSEPAPDAPDTDTPPPDAAE